jgi:hypothetical protein
MAGSRKIPHQIFRVDLNNGADINPGSLINADLRSLPEESGGDPLYVRSIRVVGKLSLTNGTGGNYNAYGQPLRCFSEFKLDVPNHQFLRNIDGERIAIDEMLMTSVSRSITTAQVIANGAGSSNYDVDFALQCCDPRNLEDAERDEDAIPVRLLKARGSVLSFKFIASMGDDATLVATKGVGLFLEFTLAPKEDLIEPTPWYLGVFEDTQLQAKLLATGAWRYVIVNQRSLTSLTPLSHTTNVGDVSLQVDGWPIYDAMLATRAIKFHEMIRSQPYYDALVSTGFGTAWTGLPLVVSPGGTRKSKLCRGDVIVKFVSRPSTWDGRTQLFHRSVGESLTNVSRAWQEAMELPRDLVMVAKTREGGNGGKFAPSLPKMLLHPNLPYPGPAARSVKHLAKLGKAG